MRERKEDIYPLFINYIQKQDPELFAALKNSSYILDKVLCAYPWPGNIRELENFSKIMLATRDPGEFSESFIARINQEIQKRKQKIAPTQNVENLNYMKFTERPFNKLTYSDKDYIQIQQALLAVNGNHTKAAELLGISRVTLWRKLKKRGKPGDSIEL